MLKERGFKKRYALGVILIVMIWIIYMLPGGYFLWNIAYIRKQL